MKNLVRFFLLSCSLFFLAQGGMHAQIPKKLSYQGLLLIDKDTPYPDSSYSITLRLYDASNAGNVLWSETQTLTTVNGVFDAILGEVSPLTLPFDKQYWLGITISPDPEFSPRVQLVANPFSFRSDTASFAYSSDTSNMSRGLTYDAIGAVLSLNGLSGRLLLNGGKGVTISSTGDTLLIDMVATIGPAFSSDSTLTIRKVGDSTDLRISNNAIDSRHIKSNAIITSKIADSAVTGNKINQMNAVIGQVLKWNGTTWAPSNDMGITYSAGKGIDITNNVITNTGDLDSTNDITIGTKAGGDLTGNYPNPIVADGKITNNKIADTAVNARTLSRMGANTGQVMKWNGTSWIASDDIGKVYKAGKGISISNDSIINTGDTDSTNDVTITRNSANGEVLGKFDSLYIKDGVVTTVKLANGAVTNVKLADTSVTGNKINRMGATRGQILKWNGITWIAANDTTGKYFPGRGIRIVNDSIINAGDTDSTNDVTLTRNSANGEVLGRFDSLYIKNGVVTTVKLANGSVTNAKLGDTSVTGGKINRMGATTGQILKWNGTTWVAANDTTGKFFAGRGIRISNDSIINTGDQDSTDDVLKTTLFNGDVSGTYANLFVKNGAITAAKLNRMGATTGQILKWNGTTWIPANDTTGKYFAGRGIRISNDSIINTGDQDSTDDVLKTTLFNGDVFGTYNNLVIKNGAVNAAKLNQMGATTGQILKWNGTTWIPANDTTGKFFAGRGIRISNDSIINTGDQDSTDDVLKTTLFNGDVFGTYNNLVIKNGAVNAA
ncbi:MAG: hypothetical protein ACKN9Y_05790, partial [Bacteroidota bacterium]